MTAPAAPPARLSEQFEIGIELGRGGFGAVYRARRRRDDAPLVLKVVSLAPEMPAALRERLLEEVRVQRGLRHENLVSLLDAGIVEGCLVMAFEEVTGTDLSKCIQHICWRDERRVRKLVLGCLAGLEVLGEAGIVHRDLKPANIMLSAAGVPRLIDLGLAKQPGVSPDLTKTGQVLGTAGYMSPEQTLGQDPDPRDDLFSLGAIAYELVTGARAFPGDSFMDRIEAQLSHTPPAPSDVSATCTVELSSFILRLLAKSREDRPASAAAAGRELVELGWTQRSTDETMTEEFAPAPARSGALGAAVSVAVLGARDGGARAPASGSSGAPGTAPGALAAAPGAPATTPARGEGAARGAAPRLRFAGAMVGLGALGLFVGWILREVSAPAPRPAAPQVPAVGAPGFPAWLRRDVGEALSSVGRARPPFDPARATRFRRGLLSARRLEKWLAAGGRLERLGDPVHEALKAADGAATAAGYGRPFFPASELRPVRGAVRSPTIDPREFGKIPPPPLPRTVTGWLGNTVHALEALTRARARWRRDVEQAFRGEPPPGFPEPALRTPDMNLAIGAYLNWTDARVFDLFRTAPTDLELRVAAAPWLAPGREAMHSGLFAAARAIQAGEQPEFAAVLGNLIRSDRHAGWTSSLLRLPTSALLGGVPPSGAGAALAAMVEAKRRDLAALFRRHHSVDAAEALVPLVADEVFFGWLERCRGLGPGGTPLAQYLSCRCALLEQAEAPPSRAGWRAQVAGLRAASQDVDAPYRGYLLWRALAEVSPEDPGGDAALRSVWGELTAAGVTEEVPAPAEDFAAARRRALRLAGP